MVDLGRWRICDFNLYWCDQIMSPNGWECNVFLFCVLIYFVATCLLSFNAIITGRLFGIPCSVWADIKTSFRRLSCSLTEWGLYVFICCVYFSTQIHVVLYFILFFFLLIFGDYQSSIDNAGQTREISLSTGSVWSCTEVHAQHIHTGIYAAGLFGLILIRITEYFSHDSWSFW